MEYYEHTLGEGETLSAVMDAYNKQHGLKIRLAHVLKANPSIKDPKKLRVGQKLRIPVVK
jgi:nucleoid-associated protein YgaU